MNTFGALKYLEAEQAVVEEIALSLKDQLNKLKVEELAIRAAIRRKMKESQQILTDQVHQSGIGQPLRAGFPEPSFNVEPQRSTRPPTEGPAPSILDGPGFSAQSIPTSKPIEVSINEALDMIKRYREGDPLSRLEEETMDTFGGESTDLEDAELEAEIDEETEMEEPTTNVVNPDLEFLDLRQAETDEVEEF
ncbi:uncharacterized protein LOC100907122 [Galendromus occidentalis]|uniref:Uncharacterized protein LOC100907122 n=1 Tax=Galendromus occidentalis TaxID=34638 RepID=A0AAJ6VVU5_9ACAR|nr:uncharacterized protein LOC100907122 [Galendromus occidentalis]